MLKAHKLEPPLPPTLTLQAAANVADLNLDIHVDTVTANKIRALAQVGLARSNLYY